MPYRAAFVLAAFIGSLGTVEVVWLLSDVLNGLMAIPNLNRVAPAVGTHRPRDAGLLHEELIKTVAIDAALAQLCAMPPASTHERTRGWRLDVSRVLETNRRTHRFRNSASARRRTSSQGMPDDSPASTRRARRSISAAHAVSRSARSVRGSSKLASSSAATSARSSTDHPRASRRNSCAREGMRSF